MPGEGFICALLLALVLSPLWVALLSFLLWRYRPGWRAWSVLPLLPVPGLAYFCLSWLVLQPHGGSTRLKFFSFHTGGDAFFDLLLFWGLTLFTLVLWYPWVPWYAADEPEARVGKGHADDKLLLLGLLIVTIPTVAAACVLGSYKTLYGAVDEGNLALAEARLQRNWEGVGPDNGYVRTILFGDGIIEQTSLLLVALENRDRPMARLLIQYGADRDRYPRWNVEGDSKGFVLAGTIRRRDYEMVEFMLDEGADPNGGSESGSPLVSMALEKGAMDIATLLVSRGARPHTTAGDGGIGESAN